MNTEYTTMTEWEALDRFEEDLNDCYGDIDVCGMKYEPARVLKLVDPTAYRYAFLDFIDAECIQIEDEE